MLAVLTLTHPGGSQYYFAVGGDPDRLRPVGGGNRGLPLVARLAPAGERGTGGQAPRRPEVEWRSSGWWRSRGGARRRGWAPAAAHHRQEAGPPDLGRARYRSVGGAACGRGSCRPSSCSTLMVVVVDRRLAGQTPGGRRGQGGQVGSRCWPSRSSRRGRPGWRRPSARRRTPDPRGVPCRPSTEVPGRAGAGL